MYVDRKKMPFVNDLLNHAVPEYNGNKVKVEAREKIDFHGTQWAGGQRYVYRVIRLEDFATIFIPTAPYQAPSPHNNTHDMNPGVAIVQYNEGNTESVTIYVHPSNLNQQLIPATPDITNDQRIVLSYTKGLKSSYAGIKNYRLSEAMRETDITPERWELAKAECIQAGYLNKAGAITITGKNAIGNK